MLGPSLRMRKNWVPPPPPWILVPTMNVSFRKSWLASAQFQMGIDLFWGKRRPITTRLDRPTNEVTKFQWSSSKFSDAQRSFPGHGRAAGSRSPVTEGRRVRGPRSRKGRGFEARRRQCVLSLSKTLYPLPNTGSIQEDMKSFLHDWKKVTGPLKAPKRHAIYFAQCLYLPTSANITTTFGLVHLVRREIFA